MQRLDHNELAWCEIDGQLVFLDIAKDRYFQLTDNLNRETLAYIQQSGLSEWHQPSWLPRPLELARPCRTLDANANGPFNLADVARAMWAQRRVERRLALKGFAPMLRDLRRTINVRTANADVSSDAAHRMISAFNHSQLIRTAADRCLPRSIALALCLATWRVGTQVVIGVKIAPFGAHCWVQAGDLVLNESVEEVQRYQPIIAI